VSWFSFHLNIRSNPLEELRLTYTYRDTTATMSRFLVNIVILHVFSMTEKCEDRSARR